MNLGDLFNEMQSKGLVSFEPTWIQKAVEQKSRNLTVYLANSKQLPLLQDNLGKAMSLVLPNETNQINWN